MAIIYCDGFDHYGTAGANLLAGGYENTEIANSDCSTTQKRTGTHALILTGSRGMSRHIGGARATVGVSLAFRTSAFGGSLQSGFNIALSYAPSTAFGSVVIGFRTNGAVAAWRGTLGSTNSGYGQLGSDSAAGVVALNTWHHIEIKATVHPSAGTVEVRVDGTTVLNLTGLDTTASTETAITQITIGNGATPTTYVDDLVIWDTTGSVNNDFLGQVKVHTVFPNGDEPATDWVRNTGSTDFDAIDDASPDGDTTYIQANNVNDVSEFALGDVSGLGTIRAVQASVLAYGAGLPARVRASILQGANVANGSEKQLVGSYRGGHDVFEVDPATSSAWTESGVNSAKLRLTRTQ